MDMSIGEMKAEAQRQKVRLNRLRRMASRQALVLEKSRRRDPRAVDYDTYTLRDAGTGKAEATGLAGLDAVEKWLTS
jgi:hypothetical protein